MVYGTYNYSYWGESKPTNITGGAHCTFYKVNKKTQILLTNAINAVPYNLLSVQQKAVSVQ